MLIPQPGDQGHWGDRGSLPCLVLCRREEPTTQRNTQRGGVRPGGAPRGEQGSCKAR